MTFCLYLRVVLSRGFCTRWVTSSGVPKLYSLLPQMRSLGGAMTVALIPASETYLPYSSPSSTMITFLSSSSTPGRVTGDQISAKTISARSSASNSPETAAGVGRHQVLTAWLPIGAAAGAAGSRKASQRHLNSKCSISSSVPFEILWFLFFRLKFYPDSSRYWSSAAASHCSPTSFCGSCCFSRSIALPA
ncbi:hypothetical protein ES705_37803 [subsurface metagenome]